MKTSPKPLSFDAFTKDIKAVRAVTMNFIVIGEAAKHVPADVRKLTLRYLGQKSMAMRNIITHDYPEIDVEKVWKTAKSRLPLLKPVMQELLSEPS